MKIQNLFTSGKMNKDLDERLLPQGEYRDALNIKVANSNGSDVGAIENALSNEALTSLDFGANPTCIGAVSDDKNRNIYWFVKSDTGSYIAEYSEFKNSSAFVLKDTRATSVLNFKRHKMITGVNVLINDNDSKAYIYWTDGLNPPRYLEVEEAKAYGENNFEEDDISVIKAPSRVEPSVSLSNSDAIDDNYIEDKLFTFAYRYKYKDNKYSVLSPFSQVAFFPNKDTFNDAPYDVYAMTNKYNTINVSYNSGSKRVLEVEVYAKEEGVQNLYLIGKFNKQEEGFLDNSNYNIKFQNNKIYRVLDENQFNRVYDNVPLKAYAQDFIGNRLVYGNYEENYNITESIDIDLEIQSTATTTECSNETFYELYNTQTIDKVVEYQLCGETAYRTITIPPLETRYVCAINIASQNGLVVDTVRSCAGINPEKTLKSNRNYIVGLVYFDKYGRKSTVLTKNDTSINIPFSSSDLSNKLKVTINNNPPQWADRYKIAIKEVKKDYITVKTKGKIHVVEEGDTSDSTNKSYTYIYVRIDENQKNKFSDGSRVILKAYDGTVYNSIDMYEVESVASYGEGDIYDNTANVATDLNEAGLYMKLTGEGVLSTLNTNNAYAYTIFEAITDKEVETAFYEVPGTYDIVNQQHKGTFQDQSEVNSAIVISEAFNAFTFGNGAESDRVKDSIVLGQFDIGVRVNEQLENYKKNIRIASLTYSDVYEETTNYNGLNTFNLAQANYKDIDEKYGQITKIHSRDNDLIVFQENKIHRILFNKNVLFTASGAGSVTQTINVLGQEVPYSGEYGISGSPESFESWGNRMYFSDERRSAILRLSQDGITEISEYGMRSWFNDNLNKNLNVRSIGGYDPINDQYVLSVQDKPVEWREDTSQCANYEWLPDEYVCDSGPSVTITGNTTATGGDTVTLTANASDPDGYITKYVWSTGGSTSTENVTSNSPGDVTYTVTVYDNYGFQASDTHTITWAAATTTTTTQAGTTTTTTQPPSPFVSINGVTAAQINDTITLTGEDYNFTGSTWSWTGGAAAGLTSKTINISESSAGSVTYGVTVDGTYTDTHAVTWSSTPTTTTTTTTAAPTTTTTTTAPPTTTTTTQAPLTAFSTNSTSETSSSSACSTSAGATKYHDGSGTYPTVGDSVYDTSSGSSSTGGGFYKAGALWIEINPSGTVINEGIC